ncbi:MAG: TlyA family RNA methyltransferase, partial [Hyphomicrobiaceae bacterium]|nr:TlyA family RNA methyltransferase [Hyphomicrobiaceae bacterium]
FEPMGRCALDVGASTGGFTEILLQHGVRRVYAVDVGHDQLHPRLRADGRVVVLERTDARSLSPERVPEAVSAIVADLSFISLTKALGPALALSVPGAWLVALIKPQFEVGRDAVGKGGVVSDPAAHARAVETVQAWLETVPGWRAAGIVPSPIAGGDGNAEFLLGARYEGQGQ